MLSCTDRAFAIEGVDQVRRVVPLDSIARVTGYQIDIAVTDLVHFEIVLADGDKVTIDENMDGFQACVALLETLPGFDRDWRDKVHWPPFASNETILFERGAD